MPIKASRAAVPSLTPPRGPAVLSREGRGAEQDELGPETWLKHAISSLQINARPPHVREERPAFV